MCIKGSLSVRNGLQKIIASVAVVSVLLLSGCETRDPIASKTFVVQSPLERQAELAKIKYWRMNGSFSIQEINQRPEIANYEWWQSDRSYRIAILSVLDLYRVDIHRMGNTVKLWKNGTLSLTAKSPEDLLQESMGWSLPVSDLQYWIKGIPAPQKKGEFYVKYDQYGHLTGLRQDGWTLQFDRYKREVDAPDFAQRITLTRPGITVKIIVRDRLFMMEKYDAPSTTA
jgi:outer membrane lipoprotein LolB